MLEAAPSVVRSVQVASQRLNERREAQQQQARGPRTTDGTPATLATLSGPTFDDTEVSFTDTLGLLGLTPGPGSQEETKDEEKRYALVSAGQGEAEASEEAESIVRTLLADRPQTMDAFLEGLRQSQRVALWNLRWRLAGRQDVLHLLLMSLQDSSDFGYTTPQQLMFSVLETEAIMVARAWGPPPSRSLLQGLGPTCGIPEVRHRYPCTSH